MSRKKTNRATSRAVATTGANDSAPPVLLDRHLPGLFLALGLILGTLYAFVMPPLQIPDEMMHFARAYSVSRGVCIASPDIDMPKSFARLNELFPHWIQKYWRISFEDLPGLALKLPLNEHDMAGNGRQRSLDGFINQNAYHCVTYLPVAVVLNAARHAALPPLVMMYLCRMTNLVVYVGLTFLALRLLPDFRILLTCVALMPTALQQAASVSADSTITAVSFLFAAYVFRLAIAPEPGKLGTRHYLILAGLILFLAASKAMICMVFLVLLIPAASFPSRRTRWLAIAACFLLAFTCVTAWQQVNQPNMQRLGEERAPHGIDVAANMRFVREHPVPLALMVVRTATSPDFFHDTLQEFVGNLGWQAVQLPDWLVWTYFALLMTAAATQTRATTFTLPLRGIVLLFSVAAVANILAAGWALQTPKLVLETPALWQHFHIYSQGRYWVPVAFPILVLFSTGRTRFDPRYFAVIAAAIVAIANAEALIGVATTYYLRGMEATDQFEGALRVQPTAVENNNLGIVFAKTPGRSADAIAHFEAALRLDPNLLPAQRNLGILLASVPGREAEAIAHLETAQRIQPDPELQRMINHLRERGPK